MQVDLAAFMRADPDGAEAEAAIRKCVHCGMCNATCPTHQLLGDELDGPRGRIYLMKEALEGAAVSPQTRLHLDRCLTCRACETTCPSSVPYGRLAEIGRRVIDDRLAVQNQARPWQQRFIRWAVREGLTRAWLFGAALTVGRLVAPLMPPSVRARIPRAHLIGTRPMAFWPDQMVLLEGCVQPALAPSINAATARVFDAVGVQCITARRAGCCGAIRHHLGDSEGGLADMRANIDAWIPLLDAGATTIVATASGCGQMIRDYGHALRHDPAYSDKARRVAECLRDVSEALLPHLERLQKSAVGATADPVAFHSPCSLQHGMQVTDTVERVLASVGVQAKTCSDSHLCCGSAGTYSIFQPKIATALRDQKLVNLTAVGASQIVTANIGCQTHLQAGTEVPVRHWIEIVDQRLALREPKA